MSKIWSYVYFSLFICWFGSVFGLVESLKKCVINIGHKRPLSRPFKVIILFFANYFFMLENSVGKWLDIVLNIQFNVKLPSVIAHAVRF